MSSNFKSIGSLALAAGLCAACASNKDEVASAEPVHCEREYRVGTNIPTRDCRPPVSEEERQRTMQAVRDATRGGIQRQP